MVSHELVKFVYPPVLISYHCFTAGLLQLAYRDEADYVLARTFPISRGLTLE